MNKLPLHDQHAMPPIVSLRRSGDIIGLLPLLKFLADKRGGPVKLVVHRQYAPILDGVSYVVPIIWDGDMENPLLACRINRAVNAQVHGHGMSADRRHGDFAKCAWNKLGYEWNRHRMLVFDRRNLLREKKLAEATFKTEPPKILVKLHSFSSPFEDANKIFTLLNAEFSGMAEVVNLDLIEADRIYDLLGLMDRAACLVSADTVTLWLAKASRCPVVALVNPTPFLGSPPTGNVLARVPYPQVVSRWDEIASAIYTTLFDMGDDGMTLVFSEFTPSDADTRRRNDVARATWPLIEARLLPFYGKRTSKDIGDSRAMPYVKDMIDGAFSSGSERIAIITNNDIKVDAKLEESIKRSCDDCGCWFAYRVESPGGPTDNGADLFAMTRQWWAEHRHLYPDLLIGFWWWDDILLRIMRWSGCRERERLYYHETHPTAMHTRGGTPGMLHNERLALPWLDQHHELNQKPES